MLDTAFQRAHATLDKTPSSESLRTMLEREYQLFTESVNQWTSLQAERYERKKGQLGNALEERKQNLQHSWENAAWRTPAQNTGVRTENAAQTPPHAHGADANAGSTGGLI